MEAARVVWNDERLDGLKGEMNALRNEVTTMRSEMDVRFDSMQRSMIMVVSAMAIGFVGVLVSIFATQL
jgi:hypothetical protein